jgi:ribose transport system ATP-binding protein
LADRIVVMREGHVVGELIGDDITEARIVEMSYHEVGPQGERT